VIKLVLKVFMRFVTLFDLYFFLYQCVNIDSPKEFIRLSGWLLVNCCFDLVCWSQQCQNCTYLHMSMFVLINSLGLSMLTHW
jgi:hypothetical protein